MTAPAPRPYLLGFGLAAYAAAMLALAPAAQAQFFWSPWFQEQPKAKKPRAVKPRAPVDDLPPIVPKESSAPPPPDDRPYDTKLLRLTEILGAVHYLRELCGAQEGQLWRNQMKDILKNEGSTAVRRAKLVNAFNDGYRGYRRTYRSCTSSATLAINRFSAEGAQIAVALAKPSVYANRNIPAEPVTPNTAAGQAAPAPGQAAPASGEAAPGQGSNAPAQNEANANAAAPAAEAAPNQGEAGQSAPAPAATDATQQKPNEASQDAAQPDAVDQGEPRRERRKRRAQRARPQAETQAPALPSGSGPQINR